MDTLQDKIAKLEKAKKHTQWTLDHADGQADCHGLAYWAGEVERLREEIKEAL